MYNFPTISQKPEASSWKEGPASDPTLRSDFEAGYQLSRARFTAAFKKWEFTYEVLPNIEKLAIEEFQRLVKYGADAFKWLNPVDNKTYIVKFAEPIQYELEDSLQNEWKVSMKLIESKPSSTDVITPNIMSLVTGGAVVS